MHDYHPFGEELSGNPAEPARSRMQFTGHERDVAVGDPTASLDYVHARYYGSQVGRFLSADPGGWDSKKPQSWNRYAYVANNPVNKVDPDGRDPVAVAGMAIGYVVGAVLEVADQGWGWQRPVDYRRVNNAGVGGAMAGLLAGASKGTVFIGAGGGALIGGFMTRKMNGETPTLVNAATDYAGGVVAGKIGEKLGTRMVAGEVEKQTMGAAALNAESLANNTGLGADKGARAAIEGTKAAGAAAGGAIADPLVGAAQQKSLKRVPGVDDREERR
ncbi:MAG: RHS repeat-associated core domain-containing protein [Thermoanaerobaculia bacterium]